MKKAFFLMCIVAISVTALAQRKNETNYPFIGTWKFSSKTFVNEFQKSIFNKRNFPVEYFTFEKDHTFRHEFFDSNNHLGKTFTGKWKSSVDNIKISYDEVDFNLSTTYFFIDADLVLGQNFNHVIFSKEISGYNVALK